MIKSRAKTPSDTLRIKDLISSKKMDEFLSPDLIVFSNFSALFSRVARSARSNSVLIVSRSLEGLTPPSM